MNTSSLKAPSTDHLDDGHGSGGGKQQQQQQLRLNRALSDTPTAHTIDTRSEPVDEQDDTLDDGMPLFSYHRIIGPAVINEANAAAITTSSQPPSCLLTCAVLGRVVLNTSNVVPPPAPQAASGLEALINTTRNELPEPWSPTTPLYIAVTGHDNGTIRITETSTGLSVLSTNATEGYGGSSWGPMTVDHPVWTMDGCHTTCNGASLLKLPPIVAVSVDASGTVLAAMDATGQVAIWTVSYTIAWRRRQSLQNGGTTTTSDSTMTGATTAIVSTHNSGGGGGLWSKLFGNRTAVPPQQPSTSSTTNRDLATDAIMPTDARTTTATTTTDSSSPTTTMPPLMVPTLTVLMTEPSHRVVQRFALTEFGLPTAFALNPAYLSLSQVVTAFDSGKLVLTTVRGGGGGGGSGGGAPWRGGGGSASGPVRLDHSLLPYMGGPPPLLDQDESSSKSRIDDWRGVEALAWQGSLLALADAGGVKLFDTGTLTALAQVDRPVGARPSLYHGSLTVVPYLVWEQSRQLLVAWGDCLLTLTVTKATQSATETANLTEATTTTTASTAPAAATTRKRTVACTMAWGLDCVAVGVVPIDRNHVAVLGRRIDWRRDEATTPNQPIVVPDDEDDGVELQVLDRSNGCVVYADMLPLRQPRNRTDCSNDPSMGHSLALAASAPHFQTMLSSFAVPRMDDALEARQNVRLWGVQAMGEFSGMTAALDGAETPLFVDDHLQWSLDHVAFDTFHETDDAASLPNDDGDTGSVDSDDYGFVIRSNVQGEAEPSSIDLLSAVVPLQDPPTLLVVSTEDLVTARLRDIDDAIDYALAHNKMALALRMALPRVRQLRRHALPDVISSYLRAVLRMSPLTGSITAHSDKRRHLSLRRMKLAAKALPVLLGGNVSFWTTWISELTKIPGALFMIRNSIPVRGEYECDSFVSLFNPLHTAKVHFSHHHHVCVCTQIQGYQSSPMHKSFAQC
jgi:hypothetical protein